MKDTSRRLGRTRDRECKTEKRIAWTQSLKRKPGYMKQIQNDRQRILIEMLREIRYRTLECSIWFDREKEYPAYTERITEKDSGKVQEISSVYAHRISGLLQGKLWKTKTGKSIGLFGQKVLRDRKKVNAGRNRKYSADAQSIGRIPDGTNLRILMKSAIVPPKNSGYSEVFA